VFSKKTLIIVGMFLSCNIYALDNNAERIMEKVYARKASETIEQDMQLSKINKYNNTKNMHIHMYKKSYGKDKYTTMFFVSPADIKGTSFLSYDYINSNKDDAQWVFLPTLKKIKRVPISSKSSSFMGSDFSYFDMTERNMKDYKYSLDKDDKKYWMIKATPKTDKIKNESGYVKTILKIRKDNYVIIGSINFLLKGGIKYFNKKIIFRKNVWVPKELMMTTKINKKTIHKTIISFKNIKVNINLSDRWFTTRRLEKGL
jgi:hypothetical protein